MSTTQYIPLMGVPAAWLLELTGNATTLAVALPSASAGAATRFKFDNLSENPAISLKLASTAEGNYIDITRADGAIIRFDAISLVLDGTDESDITDPAEESTNKAEITITTNEGDVDSSTWTEFYAKMYGKQGSYFLLVVPTAFTYDGRVNQASGNADGFIFCVVKLTSDMDQNQPGGGGHLALTFSSIACPYGESADWTNTLTGLLSIDWTATDAGGSAPIGLKGVSGFNITVESLASADALLLKAGTPVIKATTF